MGQWMQAIHNQVFGVAPPIPESGKSLLYIWESAPDFTIVYVILDVCISTEERKLLSDCHGLMFDEDNEDHPQVAKLQDLLYGEELRWQEFAHGFTTCGVLLGHFMGIYHVSDRLA